MPAEQFEMRIEYMELDALPPALRNPKEHNIDVLKEAMRVRGFNDPPAINETTGRLLEGHGRTEALKAMRDAKEDAPKRIVVRAGKWLVPVVRGVSFATDEEAEAYLLEHNRLSELGGWDDKLLAGVLQEMNKSPTIELLGWSDSEIDKLVRRQLGGSTTEEDEVPEPPKNPVSKLGDVWTLGDHQLLVGSCELLPQIVVNGSCKLMVTDPPYGVDVGGKNAFLNETQSGKRITKPIQNDNIDIADMPAFWARCWAAVQPLLAKGASYYVTGPQGGELLLLLLLLSMRDAKLPPRHTLIWAKDGLVFGRCDYHYQHEPIIYGWVDGAGHKRVEDRSETSLWQIARPKKSDLHPTMKPVELYARAMRNSSERGDLVLEPFAGSGTAYMAGEQLGRHVRGSELDPSYCDVIVQRWESFTSKKATRQKGAVAVQASAKKAARGQGRASGRPSRPAPPAGA